MVLDFSGSCLILGVSASTARPGWQRWILESISLDADLRRQFFGERVLQSAIVSLILAPKFRQVPAGRAAQARQFAQQCILSRNPEKAVELVIDSNITACVVPAPLNVQSEFRQVLRGRFWGGRKNREDLEPCRFFFAAKRLPHAPRGAVATYNDQEIALQTLCSCETFELQDPKQRYFSCASARSHARDRRSVRKGTTSRRNLRGLSLSAWRGQPDEAS